MPEKKTFLITAIIILSLQLIICDNSTSIISSNSTDQNSTNPQFTVNDGDAGATHVWTGG